MRTGNAIESPSGLIALSTNVVSWGWAAVLMAVLLGVPQVVTGNLLAIAISILIAVTGAVGLNVLTGSTGLISLGQSGFLAIGGYACAILIADLRLPVLLALPMAGLITGLASLLIGVPSLRLKGLYLAITTLAFALIITHIIIYAEPLTRGPFGIRIPDVSVLGLRISNPVHYYYVVLGVTVLVTLYTVNLMRSRTGRAWTAIRDHDIAARSMGISLVRHKLLAFFISSFIVGIAGALMALQLRFITADVFSLVLSIEALAMILVGGAGSVAGAALGAIFISFLPELARYVIDGFGAGLGISFSTHVFEIRGILTGVIIIAMLRIEPDGLMGIWRKARRYWTQWPLSL